MLRQGKNHREIIGAIALIALLYVVLALLGIGCPIKLVTGISCAGCGMTRAWLAVLHMDMGAAFKYHPLWWSIIPAVLVYIYRGRLRKRTLNIFIFIFITAFVIVYLYRLMAGGQDIVVFKPQDGLIWRVFVRAGELIRRGLYVLQ